MAFLILSENNKIGLTVLAGVSLMIFMGILLLLFFYFSKRKITQKELEKKNLELNHQKELLHATIETQEKERQRIAQDLHDEISSKLNVVTINSHLLTTHNLSEQEISEITRTIINLVKKTLDSSRRIAHDLLPPTFDKFGLDASIQELCFEINSSKSVVVQYDNSIQFRQEDKSKHLHVLRILQELTNNSIKHGQATEITITFDKNKERIRCTYKDNGRGFDANDASHKKGLGMKNIESRVGYLNGSIQVTASQNKGIEVIFEF